MEPYGDYRSNRDVAEFTIAYLKSTETPFGCYLPMYCLSLILHCLVTTGAMGNRVVERAEAIARADPDFKGVCEFLALELCCEEYQWRLWYPWMTGQRRDAPRNRLASGFFVESYLVGEPTYSSPLVPHPGRQKTEYPRRWSADYGCLDTRDQISFEAEVPPSEKEYLVRKVESYTFACPPGLIMRATPPQPARWNATEMIRQAKCEEVLDDPDVLELSHEDMKQAIRQDAHNCVSTTIDSKEMTRIEVAITRPKAVGEVYADIPEKAQWVSISEESTGLELQYKAAVGGLVFAGALLYHTYMACARAPKYRDIVLSIGARPTTPARIS